MRIKTILNRVEKHSGFIYESVRWAEGRVDSALEVLVRPRANSRPLCSGCQKPRPGYDTLAERHFAFVPLWGIPVFLIYAMRRVRCPECGIVVEVVPWADGKRRITDSYAWFLSRWAKRLSWLEVAKVFRTSWDTVFRAVEFAVEWGQEHRDLSAITAIGVDEVLWKRGYGFMTVVYEITQGRRRLLWVGEDRKEATLRAFFDWFGERKAELRFVCSDMWKPYLKIIGELVPEAVHVLDRYHVVARINKAIDEVRAKEAKRLAADGYEPVLKKTRWLILKRPENLTENQEVRLAELVRYNLATVRAYLLKEALDPFWDYTRAGWAGKYLDRWCTRVMRSRIEPMKKIARSMRGHRELLLNWFRARGEISTGVVEGLNNKLKVPTRRAYGFRTARAFKIAMYHQLGKLPEPEGTHRFC